MVQVAAGPGGEAVGVVRVPAAVAVEVPVSPAHHVGEPVHGPVPGEHRVVDLVHVSAHVPQKIGVHHQHGGAAENAGCGASGQKEGVLPVRLALPDVPIVPPGLFQIDIPARRGIQVGQHMAGHQLGHLPLGAVDQLPAVVPGGEGLGTAEADVLGTGVGAGVIANGRIYSGFNQAGSEFGHTVLVSGGVQCGCGRKGCFEQYASASALARMTKEAAEANPDSLLNDLYKEEGEWNARIAFVAMRQGDQVAKDVVEMYTDYLADGLANAINTFMPEVLVVGGGVCNEGDTLLIPMREKTMSRPYFGPGVKKTRIELAQMGNDAGIVGAAMMGKSCVDDGKNGK